MVPEMILYTYIYIQKISVEAQRYHYSETSQLALL